MLIIWNRYAIMLFVALKRMHELGISHTDLSMRNIAFYQSSIENRGFPNFSITLIDFGHALYTHKPLFGNNKVQYLTNKCYNHQGTPPFRSLDTILSIFPTGPSMTLYYRNFNR